jgi:hypothetical protein
MASHVVLNRSWMKEHETAVHRALICEVRSKPKRNRCRLVDIMVLFLFELVTATLSILNYPNRGQVAYTIC